MIFDYENYQSSPIRQSLNSTQYTDITHGINRIRFLKNKQQNLHHNISRMISACRVLPVTNSNQNQYTTNMKTSNLNNQKQNMNKRLKPRSLALDECIRNNKQKNKDKSHEGKYKSVQQVKKYKQQWKVLSQRRNQQIYIRKKILRNQILRKQVWKQHKHKHTNNNNINSQKFIQNNNNKQKGIKILVGVSSTSKSSRQQQQHKIKKIKDLQDNLVFADKIRDVLLQKLGSN